MRSQLILIVLFASLIFNGCATIGVAGPPASDNRNVLFEDTIYAIGKIKTSQDLVLIGQQNTYLISQGSKELLSLATLNPVQLYLNGNRPIYLEFDGAEFTSKVEVSYSSSKLTDMEGNVLRSIGAAYMSGQGDQKIYMAKLDLRGKIYAKELQASDINSHLAQSREIKIVSSNTKISNNTSGKTFALPLALAFDIITSPIQIILLPKDLH